MKYSTLEYLYVFYNKYDLAYLNFLTIMHFLAMTFCFLNSWLPVFRFGGITIQHNNFIPPTLKSIKMNRSREI